MQIGIYSTAGDRLSEFGAYGANDKQLCMADFVAVDSHDRVIVADSGNHCLKLFDPNAAGKPIGRISQRGDTDGCLHWPKGVAIDPRDNIIVADTNNNRISQFASDGQFVAHLLTDTPKPYHVAVNGAGNMMGVSHFALSGISQVDVYSLEDASDTASDSPLA